VFGIEAGSDTATLGEISALTLAPDGRVLALDANIPAVRVFDADLRPIAIWGRRGAGPGEFNGPDGGLAVLSDGRIAVRDPNNARIQLLGPDGRDAGSWGVISAQFRARTNFSRMGDTLLSRVVMDQNVSIDQWRFGLMRIAPDGRVLDTLLLPKSDLPTLTLKARRGGNNAELPLPWAPSGLWAWTPLGGFVVARGDRYAITWRDRGFLLRAERTVTPEPVTEAERAQEEAYATKGLQWLDPTWQWTGPAIPQTKPLIHQLLTGEDGRIWAVREGPAVEGNDPDYQPNEPSSVERRWRPTYRFDVFAPDATFLGTVAVPTGLQLRPAPVFSGDVLTGLEVDAEGVPRLVRYRVTPERAPR
jgi:hypothetical protein